MTNLHDELDKLSPRSQVRLTELLRKTPHDKKDELLKRIERLLFPRGFIDRLIASRDDFVKYLFFSCLFVFIVWGIFLSQMLHNTSPTAGLLDNWALRGDSFNIITSLFSGLAFAGVIVSLIIQRKDFELSLEEIREAARAQSEVAREMRVSRDERRAELYNRFNTNNMMEARTVFWECASRYWFSDAEFREHLVYYSQLREKQKLGEFLEMSVDFGGTRRPFNEIRYMCSHIVDFYAFIDRVYDDGDDSERRSAAMSFYYDWWRGFLLSYAECSKDAYNKIVVETGGEKQLSFDPKLQALLDLDKKLCLSEFDASRHPYYLKVSPLIMSNEATFFPMSCGPTR